MMRRLSSTSHRVPTSIAAATIITIVLLNDVLAVMANDDHLSRARASSSSVAAAASSSDVRRKLHQKKKKKLLTHDLRRSLASSLLKVSNDKLAIIFGDDDDVSLLLPSSSPPSSSSSTIMPTTAAEVVVSPPTASPSSTIDDTDYVPTTLHPTFLSSPPPTSTTLSSSALPSIQSSTVTMAPSQSIMTTSEAPSLVVSTDQPTTTNNLSTEMPSSLSSVMSSMVPSSSTLLSSAPSSSSSIESSEMPSSSIESSVPPSYESSEMPSSLSIDNSEVPSATSSSIESSSSAAPSSQSTAQRLPPSIQQTEEPTTSSSSFQQKKTTEMPSSQPTSLSTTITLVPTAVTSSTTDRMTDSPSQESSNDITTSSTTASTSSTAECPEGTCPNPNSNGRCETISYCLVDPCEVENSCTGGGVCQVNYCGGCHALCVVGDVVEEEDDDDDTSHPSTSPTTTSNNGNELSPAEVTIPTSEPTTTTTELPIVQVPKIKFTLIETLGVLSDEALMDVTVSIETFLSAQLDAYYNSNKKVEEDKYFSGIYLNVVDDEVVARAAPASPPALGGEGGVRRRHGRKLSQDGVVIGTEIILNGVADFVDGTLPPSPAEILSEIIYLGRRYNTYLISNITSVENDELDGVYQVEVDYYSGFKAKDDMMMIDNLLPVQQGGAGDDNEDEISTIINGMKKKELQPEDGSSKFLVIATVAGVAILTFLLFALASREKSSRRNNRSRGGRRDPVTVPVTVVASGSRSRSSGGSGGKGGNGTAADDEEDSSDPFIKCHQKANSHISDLTTLASQPFARIVRSGSQLEEELDTQPYATIVRTQSELEKQYESTMMQDGEEGNFVNGCYTQDYSNYYNNSRSRSQEEASSSTQRNVDESYLPGGWYATQNNDGGVWNSLRSSELESSYDGTASSFSASGAAASGSRLSCHSSIEPCSELPLAPTPIHTNKSAVGRSFEQERDAVAILLDHIDSLESMRQTDSEESQSQQSSLPRNDSLPAEWLTAMHGDNSSIDGTASWSSATASKSFDQSLTSKGLRPDLPTANASIPTASDTFATTERSSDNDSVLSLKQTNSGESECSSSSMSRSDSPPVEGPASPPSNTCSASSFHEKSNKNKGASLPDQVDSVPSLKQTDSEESDKSSSSSSKSDSSANEWLTAVQGDNSSYTLPPKSTIEERKCSIERSGGFLSTTLHTEEDSEPSVHLQRKRTFFSDDAFSTSSEEEDEEEEKQSEILEHLSPEQRSSNLLSVLDAGYGPSMDDLVWLEQKIREKKIAEATKKRDEFDVNTNLDDYV